jgi:hypothetical protein
MMIRSEIDACLVDPASKSTNPTLVPYYSSPELKIFRSSHHVPQSSIVELKTTVKPQINMAETFSQLYFSQTQHLFVGKHQRGTFHKIEQHQLGTGVLAGYQQKAQPNMQRLGSLLRNVQNIAIKRGAADPFAVIWSDGHLSIRGIKNHISMLPEELLGRFEQ